MVRGCCEKMTTFWDFANNNPVAFVFSVLFLSWGIANMFGGLIRIAKR